MKCPQLAGARTQVVVGSGNADAELMLVAEAPGVREDEQGEPIVGAAGRYLDALLSTIGLAREDVFVAYVLKCHPPGNRDPSPAEIARCSPYLHEQIALVEPRVVCTLGSFATKLLRGEGEGIDQRHGRVEAVTVGRRAVHLLPLFHPAAALYSRASRATLEADVLQLPELLARPAPPQPELEAPAPEPDPRAGSPEEDPTDLTPEPGAVAGAELVRTAPEPEPTEPTEPEPKSPEPPEGPQLGLF